MTAPSAVAAASFVPGGGAADPAAAWDVRSWIFGPRRPFRVSTLYSRAAGVIVTAVGQFDDAAAAAAMAAALRPFESLPGTVVVDVCHATLGHRAVTGVVDVGIRRGSATSGHGVVITHADPETRGLFARAGGAQLLRPCSCCRSQPRRRPVGGYW